MVVEQDVTLATVANNAVVYVTLAGDLKHHSTAKGADQGMVVSPDGLGLLTRRGAPFYVASGLIALGATVGFIPIEAPFWCSLRHSARRGRLRDEPVGPGPLHLRLSARARDEPTIGRVRPRRGVCRDRAEQNAERAVSVLTTSWRAPDLQRLPG